MSVAHAVFASVSTAAASAVYHWKVTDVAVVAHFEVNADSPIDACARTVHVHVCNAAFDDLSEDLASALIDCDADLWFVTGIEVLSDDWRKLGWGNFIEGVSLFL
ncbi:hypothetical protein KXW75_005531, partial [Aspergillus fumigatus]